MKPSFTLTSIVSLLFCLFATQIQAQYLNLEGKVVDQKTGELLPFVHIQLEGVALGTVTEADGQFRIRIPQRYQQRTLVFSYLGYEDQKVRVGDLKTKITNTIKLKIAAEMLAEVVVKPRKLPGSKAILRRVFRNLEENYAEDPGILHGYYRETIKENGSYIKFSDAACSYYSVAYPKKKLKWKDYASPFGNYYSTLSVFSDFAGANLHRIHFHYQSQKDEQVKIIDSRASLNGTQRDMKANIAGGPLSLFARNRMKYQQSFLGPKRNRDFEYTVDEVQDSQGNWLYQLHFKTKVTKAELDEFNPRNRKQWNKANKHKLLEGYILVNPEDYAVVHYECWIPNELKPYFCGYKTMAIKHFDYKLDVDFKKTKGKYRLERIYHEDEFIFKDTTDNTVTPYAAISEFNTLEVQTDTIKAFPPTLNFGNFNNNQLYDYALEFDSTFWVNYMQENPIALIDSTIRSDMEKEKTLEQQFRDKQLRDLDLPEPEATPKQEVTTIHNTKLIDNYAWLKNTKAPRAQEEIMDYLNAENAYTDNYFIPLRKLQRELAAQLRFSVEKDFTSLPTRDNGYFYYTSFSEEQEYPVFYRKPIGQTDKKEILLDVNTMKANNYFYQAGGIQASPNNQLISYYENTTGSDKYIVKFKNLTDGKLLSDSLNLVAGMLWLNDST
ncbi:MAG: carboxypeptidase-like regulatory domain-containing protein, partial [Bacteroidota bacterium]